MHENNRTVHICCVCGLRGTRNREMEVFDSERATNSELVRSFVDLATFIRLCKL